MSNFETTSAENSRLWRLTDKQVLDAMRGRGNELATAKSLAFLCQMFAKAADANPGAAPGLLAAIGLTQLYGVGIAPGHEDHPFRNVDKNMTVASILSGESTPTVKRFVPPPVKHRVPPPERNEFGAENHLQPGDIPKIPLCDHEGYVGHCPKCHSDIVTFAPGDRAEVVVGFEHGRCVGTLKSVQNIPKPKPKTKRVAEIVMAMLDEMGADGMLTARAVHFRCDSDITYQDVQNGLVMLRSHGKIDKSGHGYRRAA